MIVQQHLQLSHEPPYLSPIGTVRHDTFKLIGCCRLRACSVYREYPITPDKPLARARMKRETTRGQMLRKHRLERRAFGIAHAGFVVQWEETETIQPGDEMHRLGVKPESARQRVEITHRAHRRTGKLRRR